MRRPASARAAVQPASSSRPRAFSRSSSASSAPRRRHGLVGVRAASRAGQHQQARQRRQQRRQDPENRHRRRCSRSGGPRRGLDPRRRRSGDRGPTPHGAGRLDRRRCRSRQSAASSTSRSAWASSAASPSLIMRQRLVGIVGQPVGQGVDQGLAVGLAAEDRGRAAQADRPASAGRARRRRVAAVDRRVQLRRLAGHPAGDLHPLQRQGLVHGLVRPRAAGPTGARRWRRGRRAPTCPRRSAD